MEVLKTQYRVHKQNVDAIVEAIHDSNGNVSFALYSLLVVMLVVGVGISQVLVNLISSGLIRLQTTVEEIEENGDLTLRAEVHQNDEVDSVAETFNRLVDNLANSVSQIMAQPDQLATAAEQTSASSNELSQLGEQLRSLVAQFKV